MYGNISVHSGETFAFGRGFSREVSAIGSVVYSNPGVLEQLFSRTVRFRVGVCPINGLSRNVQVDDCGCRLQRCGGSPGRFAKRPGERPARPCGDPGMVYAGDSRAGVRFVSVAERKHPLFFAHPAECRIYSGIAVSEVASVHQLRTPDLISPWRIPEHAFRDRKQCSFCEKWVLSSAFLPRGGIDLFIFGNIPRTCKGM
jgi:hypothetical protein